MTVHEDESEDEEKSGGEGESKNDAVARKYCAQICIPRKYRSAIADIDLHDGFTSYNAIFPRL